MNEDRPTLPADGHKSVDPSQPHVCTYPVGPLPTPRCPSHSYSLDSQETSASRDFDQFWHAKNTELEWQQTPTLDTTSHAARFRHAGWHPIRKLIWSAMERTGQSASRRRSFGECGSQSWLEQSCTAIDRFRVRHNHCNDRLCTPCSNQRSLRLRDALLQQIGRTPCSFITLTLCGKGEPLTDLIDRLYRSFKALRQLERWTDKVRGGAAFLELKWSDKAARWHPHLHIIADADFLPQGELSEMWRAITRDSYIVDVRRVRQPEVTGAYVTKYASKPLNMSFCRTPELLDEAMRVLKGRRLCLCFGTWYGTSLTNAEDEELNLESEEKFHFFAPLEDILSRATAGERNAIAVLKMAHIEGLWRASLDSS